MFRLIYVTLPLLLTPYLAHACGGPVGTRMRAAPFEEQSIGDRGTPFVNNLASETCFFARDCNINVFFLDTKSARILWGSKDVFCTSEDRSKLRHAFISVNWPVMLPLLVLCIFLFRWKIVRKLDNNKF
jgi:hypothetical protein